ncbi:AarF/UbiB family protein [Leptospira sp. GIMC2001]|uniref:AarF/UbiB family protein n=1 Tax=Leptospira sp. GIMC2001 TaxID=1513297 RepID=UPI00234AFDF1|nr:AarF/UbiB family protein [Leptospira sp. GIMC2001]WCL48663.1 AarF/UbiB family protein [Leptospira sp. GIMC2001]
MNLNLTNLVRAAKTGIYSLSSTFGTEHSRQKAIQSLAAMRGLPTKFAQIKASLIGSEGALWKEAVSNLPELENDLVLQTIDKLSPILYSKINLDMKIEKCPASIGQVNRITLNNGYSFAVKIQYPNIENQLDQDTGLLDLAASMFAGFQEGFDSNGYKKFIGSALREELDYSTELTNQNHFREFFEKNRNIVIPNTILEYSNESILVQEWEDSTPIEIFLQTATLNEREQIANFFKDFYFESIFRLGMVHTDPNSGNFGIRKRANQLQLVVYDFGSVYQFNLDQRIALLLLIKNQNDHELNDTKLLEQIGFRSDTLLPIQSSLKAYLSVVLEPFLELSPYDLSKWKRVERCSDILGARRFQFMLAATPEIFPVIRAFMGFFHWSAMTSGKVWVRPSLERMEQELSEEIREFKIKITANLKLRIDANVHENTETNHDTNFDLMEEESIAKFLRIEVYKNKILTVQLEFHRNMIERLDEIMDTNILSKISGRGISIPEIIRKARVNSYKPMMLFEWIEDELDGDLGENLRVRVYLE